MNTLETLVSSKAPSFLTSDNHFIAICGDPNAHQSLINRIVDGHVVLRIPIRNIRFDSDFSADQSSASAMKASLLETQNQGLTSMVTNLTNHIIGLQVEGRIAPVATSQSPVTTTKFSPPTNIQFNIEPAAKKQKDAANQGDLRERIARVKSPVAWVDPQAKSVPPVDQTMARCYWCGTQTRTKEVKGHTVVCSEACKRDVEEWDTYCPFGGGFACKYTAEECNNKHRDCRYGKNCRNEKCHGAGHPDDWDPATASGVPIKARLFVAVVGDQDATN